MGNNVKGQLRGDHEADEYITEKGLRNSSTRVYPKGTLLMAMYGQGQTRGRVGILGIDAAINQACASLEPNERVSRDYLFQYLWFQYVPIRQLSQGGNQANLNGELIKSIRVLLPPLPEQRAIAAILSTWDRAIEQTTRLIRAKRRVKKGLMQQLLTGMRRLTGFSEAWQWLKAGEVFGNHSQRNSPNETLLSVTQEQGVVPRELLDTRVPMPHGNLDSFKLVEPGDFVISPAWIVLPVAARTPAPGRASAGVGRAGGLCARG